MDPENMKTKNFEKKRILYDNEEFSIACGNWIEKGKREDVISLAMRWNNCKDQDKGFPLSRGNPVWFIYPRKLSRDLLISLLGRVGSRQDYILETLNDIQS